ncbi:cell envelope integrity protein CreD [Thalassolituus sp. LLYu03]|uniref:cell envelope integrity protein CreD n=1 Tax=Thalassolituus sp. LLYu03 TaxID=3421656 RepID=UPI003D2E41BE
MRTLLIKLVTIGSLMLLLMIPLTMIRSTVDERKHYSEAVANDIARSASYSQTVTGPVLVVPFQRTQIIQEFDSNRKMTERTQVIHDALYFLPEHFQLNGQLTSELRYRGIYAARLYQADTQITAEYNLPADYGIRHDLASYHFDTPYLALGINDIRGIRDSFHLQVNNREYRLEPGSRVKNLGDGVHAQLTGLDSSKAQKLQLSLPLKLQGTGQFYVTPTGKNSSVRLQADWPHPSFTGNFLPIKSDIHEQGFEAEWQTSLFATNVNETFSNCLRQGECQALQSLNFGVSLIDPVNQYVKTHRAMKYALMFVVLIFGGFFLFEVLKSLQIHPIQYGLVGLSLALFYLLLISLSEHIAFITAYIIAATACVAVISTYLAAILRNLKNTLGFACGLMLLYIMLYGLLSSEDFALLMGSILIFTLLSLFMLLTRHVDWYRFSQPANPATEEPGSR